MQYAPVSHLQYTSYSHASPPGACLSHQTATSVTGRLGSPTAEAPSLYIGKPIASQAISTRSPLSQSRTHPHHPSRSLSPHKHRHRRRTQTMLCQVHEGLTKKSESGPHIKSTFTYPDDDWEVVDPAETHVQRQAHPYAHIATPVRPGGVRRGHVRGTSDEIPRSSISRPGKLARRASLSIQVVRPVSVADVPFPSAGPPVLTSTNDLHGEDSALAAAPPHRTAGTFFLSLRMMPQRLQYHHKRSGAAIQKDSRISAGADHVPAQPRSVNYGAKDPKATNDSETTLVDPVARAIRAPKQSLCPPLYVDPRTAALLEEQDREFEILVEEGWQRLQARVHRKSSPPPWPMYTCRARRRPMRP
jgi:hypothetical protein